MLNKYKLILSGDCEEVQAFLLGIVQAKENKKFFEKKINYFKGMNYNWFPVVLLYRVKYYKTVNPPEMRRALDVFNILMGYSEYESYYIDSYVSKGNRLEVIIRGKNDRVFNDIVGKILSFYNLNCEGYNLTEMKKEDKEKRKMDKRVNKKK